VNNRINLATKPFTNRVLPWVVTVVLVFFSLVALIFILRATSEANAKAAVVQKEINDLNQQEQEMLKQAEQVKEALTSEQKQSLKSAHELVDRKRFSWMRLFADLEAVLPASVRVGRIAVRQIRTQAGSTVADLELTVIAKSPNAVTDMIAVMDREGIFRAELRSQNLAKGKGEAGSEYELSVQYSPRASFVSSSDQGPRAAVEHSTPEIPGGTR
jgi:Tfp pilus assembly protein PilN